MPLSLEANSSCSLLSPKKRTVLNLFLCFGPVALPAYVMVIALAILTLFRTALTFSYLERFQNTDHYWWLFVVGIRMDLIILSYVLILPSVLLLLLPRSAIRVLSGVFAGWIAFVMSVLIYMEIATFPFVAEFDLRPDQKFLEYLNHTHEVVPMLLKVYLFELIVGFVALIFSLRYFWRASRYLLIHSLNASYRQKLLLFPLVGAVLFLGARSSIGHRPANLSSASFSENHLANEFALNSTYSMLYAAYRMFRHAKNPSLDYGKMERTEILERVAKRSFLPVDSAKGDIPFLHKQSSPFKYSKPPNVVIFLQESMGAVDVGCLKGPPITPNLCRLKEEGLWFSNLYATGTRTVRGIEATVSGFLPTSAAGVLKLGLAKKDFFTAATLFKRHGYDTEFLYGGMSNFDEMRSFFLGNDFETIYDQPTFESPIFEGTWGVSDEDLVTKANQVFAAKREKPFFALMLSTSNHSPYEFPDNRIELYEQPKQTHLNAIKYADYSINLFFELAKKEKYFENTIFLVVADHNSHVSGNELVPIRKFHIPGLLIGPNIPKGTIEKTASQIDLLPTILHFTGLQTEHPMLGRDMMSLPASEPGRAFMQYGSNHAYMVGSEVVIQRPFLSAEQFTYRDETLFATSLKSEMAADALAYAHVPWILYSEQRYRLPAQQK